MQRARQVCRAAALVVGMAACAVAAGASTTDEELREFAVEGGGKLVVRVDDGAVQVRTHEQDRAIVRVHRTVNAASEEPERALLDLHRFSVVQEGDEIRVDAGLPREARSLYGKGKEFRVRFEVLLPRRFDARIRTSDGDISLEALEGDIDLKTSDGSVAVPISAIGRREP